MNSTLLYPLKLKYFHRLQLLGQLRWGSSTAKRFQQNSIGVIGAPFDRGQPIPGVEEGPKLCRKSGFIPILKNALKLDVKDYGDLDFGLSKRSDKVDAYVPTGGRGGKSVPPKHLEEVASATHKLSSAITEILREDRIALTLGGDHSIAIGTIHGVSTVHPDLAVLWVDAHGDINTISSSTTGNMHGMPVSFILKEMQPYMVNTPNFDWLQHRISAKNLAYIGLRDVDFSERAAIEMLGISTFSMKDVDQLGIRNVVQIALDKISPRGIRPVHLSFDIDSLDDIEVSTTGTPVSGGLTLREGNIILEELRKRELMVSMDLVEVNPSLGTAQNVNRTMNVVRQLLTSAFGFDRGGMTDGKTLPRLH